jgi:hypothetical protein
MQEYYLLTEKELNFYVYSKTSSTLERKADFNYGLNVLMIRETVEYLLNHNEGFRIAAKGD